MGKIVTYEIDFDNPPPLTEEQRSEIQALLARPEEEIDYSDIPPLDENFWVNAKPFRE